MKSEEEGTGGVKIELITRDASKDWIWLTLWRRRPPAAGVKAVGK
jgi:hypothetical protein